MNVHPNVPHIYFLNVVPLAQATQVGCTPKEVHWGSTDLTLRRRLKLTYRGVTPDRGQRLMYTIALV